MPYQYVREPLTAEESDRLSNACETPTERLVVWTLLDTGLRVSELCDLTRRTSSGSSTSSGSRARAALTIRRPRSAWCRCPDVYGRSWSTTSRWRRRFLSRRDAPRTSSRRWPTSSAITKDVSPHVLRHTFSTMALQKGISLPPVQKILGHDSLQRTAIYLNFTDVHIHDEFERKW